MFFVWVFEGVEFIISFKYIFLISYKENLLFHIIFIVYMYIIQNYYLPLVILLTSNFVRTIIGHNRVNFVDYFLRSPFISLFRLILVVKLENSMNHMLISFTKQEFIHLMRSLLFIRSHFILIIIFPNLDLNAYI